MAHFKCPKTIIFSELPKTSTGKIQEIRAAGTGEGHVMTDKPLAGKVALITGASAGLEHFAAS